MPVNPARGLRILLAILLLSAQQAALSHAIFHLDRQGLPAEQRTLCDQHDALGTVAGALGSVVVPPVAVAVPVRACSVPDLPAASQPGLAPSSRGPPALF
jgi:hypothetical protein